MAACKWNRRKCLYLNYKNYNELFFSQWNKQEPGKEERKEKPYIETEICGMELKVMDVKELNEKSAIPVPTSHHNAKVDSLYKEKTGS